MPSTPHIHALATQGAFRPTGEFLEVGTVHTDLLEQLFRRLVLIGLHRAERLSAEFRDTLLSWTHSGFSVHAGPRIYPWEADHLARLGRYIARVPMPQKEVRLTEAGKVRILTPPDPRTGGTELELDPLECGGRACRVTCELGDRMPGAEPCLEWAPGPRYTGPCD